MKHILSCTILFVFACFSSLFSQSLAELDSLYTLLPSQRDTAAINTMLQIAKYHILLGPDADSAEVYALRAMKESEAVGYGVGTERALFCMGHVFGLRNDYAQSNAYYEQALVYMDEYDGKKGVAAVYNNIGKNYLQANEYEKALDYFLRSLTLEEEMEPTPRLYSTYNNIAVVQYMLEQYDKARANRLKAYYGHLAFGDKLTAVHTLINLVVDYRHTNQLDSAYFFARKGMELSEEIGMQEGIVRAGNQLAQVSRQRGQYEEAIRYATQSIQEADTLYHLSPLVAANRCLSVVYDSLGQFSTALIYANVALKWAQRLNTALELIEVYEQMSHVHQRMGNYQAALQFKDAYYVLRDSVFSVEKEGKIRELQARYDQEKNKLAIASQAAELREKNFYLVALSVGALLLAVIFFLYNRQQILREKEQTLEARQRLLRSQINPHFLFNALASIQQVIYEKEDRTYAAMYLTKFAKLMRLILENSREAYIPLEQELETLRNYLELQKMRFQDVFDFEIYIDPDIDPEEVMIPPMFAQPFIENSLEHGILHKNERGFIRLAFAKKGDLLEFEVEDNGIGREQSAFYRKSKEHRSLATEITRDRLSLLGKAVKKQIDLRITDKLDDQQQVTGTRVTFSLPLIYG